MDGAFEGKCPVMHTGTVKNQAWWPNQISLKMLHQAPHSPDPMGDDFNYVEAFKSLDLNEVMEELKALLTDSQDWWPADYGHYGPLYDPHGVAQCGHLPGAGRTRWRVVRDAAFCAAELMA